jgi:hypothetical protein
MALELNLHTMIVSMPQSAEDGFLQTVQLVIRRPLLVRAHAAGDACGRAAGDYARFWRVVADHHDRFSHWQERPNSYKL